jgi:hypothetical protein
VIVVSESICILAGMLALMAGYYQSALFPVAIACFVIGALWFLSQWRHWTWAASLGLFVFISAAGVGIWIGLSPILMAIGVLGSLSAWDLADFSRRLGSAAPGDDLRKLEKKHLIRLASLAVVGLALILAALVLHTQISFGWVFLLTVAAVLGMVQLVNRFRRGRVD